MVVILALFIDQKEKGHSIIIALHDIIVMNILPFASKVE